MHVWLLLLATEPNAPRSSERAKVRSGYVWIILGEQRFACCCNTASAVWVNARNARRPNSTTSLAFALLRHVSVSKLGSLGIGDKVANFHDTRLHTAGVWQMKAHMMVYMLGRQTDSDSTFSEILIDYCWPTNGLCLLFLLAMDFGYVGLTSSWLSPCLASVLSDFTHELGTHTQSACALKATLLR